MDDISDELQCPVCLLIPREVPIPACPAGHIVCKDCRVNVKTCPTCRRPMKEDGTNTLANKMIERVPHPCKYSQCPEKNYLKEIKEHEARCRERTIKCPHLPCNDMVKVSEFKKYAMSTKNCINYNIHSRNSLLVFHQNDLSRTSGVCDCLSSAFEDRGELFLFHTHFFVAKQTFAFYVTSMAREAEKYLVKMRLKNLNDDRKSLSIAQNVMSIDSAPRNYEAMWASKSVMFVQWKTISEFMKWRQIIVNGIEETVSNIEINIDILND